MSELSPKYRQGNIPLVLVVEDEEQWAAPVLSELAKLSIDAIWAQTVSDAYNRAITMLPDLIILDVNIEQEGDGFDLLTDLREITTVPILVLTGRKTFVEDTDTAAERHATSYYQKAITPPESVAKFAAQNLTSLGKRNKPKIRLGDLVLDTYNNTLSIGTETVVLTDMLSLIMAKLMEPPGGWVSSINLAEHCYGMEDDTYFITPLRQHITRLRNRLAEIEEHEVTIESKRSLGYCLYLDGEEISNIEEGKTHA